MRTVRTASPFRREYRPTLLAAAAIAFLLLPAGVGQEKGLVPLVAPSGTAPLVVTISGNTTTMLLGTERLLSANATGGAPPYAYQWYATGPNGSLRPIGSAFSVDFRPLTDGVFTINLTASDQGGNRSGSSVYIDASGPSPISLRLDSASTGNSLVLTANVSGGTPPYWFRWSAPGIDPNRTRASSVRLANLPSGSYPVRVEVADAIGYSNSTSARVVVTNSAPMPPWIDLAVGIGLGIALSLPIVWYRFRRRRSTQKPTAQSKSALK